MAKTTHRVLIPALLVGIVVVISILGMLLRHHATAEVNRVALADNPKPVTVVRAQPSSYQQIHRHVGTLRPWVEAKVGPQFLSAYVTSVLVRPGTSVAKNQVLATLDCRDASAKSRSVALQAQALQSEQVAMAAQAQRVTRLLDGGYVAANDVEQQTAQSNADLAKTEAEKSRLIDTQLSVSDCILRAPFDGDVGARWLDPGAFVHPGEPIVSVIDRLVVRLVADVPEEDFGAVAPGTQVTVQLLALGSDLSAVISRRSPAADPVTRTVHIEIDIPDPKRSLPVNTTAELHVGVGQPISAMRLPLTTADETQGKAQIFVVEDGAARAMTVPILGELGGDLFLAPGTIPEGTLVVTEGRGGLRDKDRVDPHEATGLPSVGQEHTHD